MLSRALRSKVGSSFAAAAALALAACGSDKAPGVPAPPGAIEAAAGDANVVLGWGPVAGADSYVLRVWSTAAGAAHGSVATITGVRPPYRHESLTNGATYWYSVTAAGRGGEGPRSAQVSATPLAAHAPVSGSATIPAAGGSVALEGVAAATFPGGSFDSDRVVRIETSLDSAAQRLFDVSAASVLPGPRSGYEVRINTGASRPAAGPVHVVLVAPPALPVPAGHALQAFVQRREAGDLEEIDGFRVLRSMIGVGPSSLAVDVDAILFSNARRQDGTYEVVLLLASTPEPGSGQLSRAAADPCAGTGHVLGPPLAPLTVLSPFNPNRDNSFVNAPPGHFGTDFVARSGDPVFSPGEGRVVGAHESTGGGWNDNGGAGGTVTIYLPGTGTVRYMHLAAGSIQVHVGDQVTLGQQVAAADNTGRSAGSHLHVTFTAEGSTTPVDPMRYIDTGGGTYSGSLDYDYPFSVASAISFDAPLTGTLPFTAARSRGAICYDVTGGGLVTGPVSCSIPDCQCSGAVSDPVQLTGRIEPTPLSEPFGLVLKLTITETFTFSVIVQCKDEEPQPIPMSPVSISYDVEMPFQDGYVLDMEHAYGYGNHRLTLHVQ